MGKLSQGKGCTTNSSSKKFQQKSNNEEHEIPDQKNPFHENYSVSELKINKYAREKNSLFGGALRRKQYTAEFAQNQLKKHDAAKLAARTEILQAESRGFLEAEEGEHSSCITQREIKDSVDVLSARKSFELNLKFGPYRASFTRNGRHVLLTGRVGHIAAFDWQTKKLMCELNVRETVYDSKWLHVETMYAVAQKSWTYIYDNQGIELHCLKTLNEVQRLEFLPFHFLLVGAHANGYLTYVDSSLGTKVSAINTKLGRLSVMTQNPTNAIIHLGHNSGKVTLWSPNSHGPLVSMLCHRTGLLSMAVDHSGRYMATSAVDRTIKIWDLRMYQQLQEYKLPSGAACLDFSHTRLLAAAIGNVIEVYKDCIEEPIESSYISHDCGSYASNFAFCPYEDVLAVGHADGFVSLLVPGAGEANFDALEANPYQSKKQRQEMEVRMLLDKIQPELISLDASFLEGPPKDDEIGKFGEEVQLKSKFHTKVELKLRNKKKGGNKAGRVEKRKQLVKSQKKREKFKGIVNESTGLQKSINDEGYDMFARFKVSNNS